MVERGTFRADLFYRLETMTIEIPPLRERKDEIRSLVDHFLRRACTTHGRAKVGLTPEAWERLNAYDWPGNIRELRNAIERAVVIASGEIIDATDLPRRLRDATDETAQWEINLLPLRSDFGMIDRVIGCLHPLVGLPRMNRQTPLRFRIETMSVEPIDATVRELDLPEPIEGFAEPRVPFTHEPMDEAEPRFKTIEGGLDNISPPEDRPAPTRGHLRLVKD